MKGDDIVGHVPRDGFLPCTCIHATITKHYVLNKQASMTSTTCALNRKYALNKHVHLITGLYGNQKIGLKLTHLYLQCSGTK